MQIDRIDARDVLDPNAKTTCAFQARVVGRFRHLGPDAWDDYAVEAVAGGEVIEVLADVPVQVEPAQARFRMRWRGEVVRLAWLPKPDDDAAPGVPTVDLHRRFVVACCRPFAEAAGLGAAAGIAKALTVKAPKPSLD